MFLVINRNVDFSKQPHYFLLNNLATHDVIPTIDPKIHTWMMQSRFNPRGESPPLRGWHIRGWKRKRACAVWSADGDAPAAPPRPWGVKTHEDRIQALRVDESALLFCILPASPVWGEFVMIFLHETPHVILPLIIGKDTNDGCSCREVHRIAHVMVSTFFWVHQIASIPQLSDQHEIEIQTSNKYSILSGLKSSHLTISPYSWWR